MLDTTRFICHRDTMFLRHFDPGDVAPELLVNRAPLLDWLTEAFNSYFEDARTPGDSARSNLMLGLHGEKGIGKSIVAQVAIQQLKENFSGEVLFLSIDCRPHHSMRDVLGEIAEKCLQELRELRQANPGLPATLIDQANVLVDLTRYEKVEMRGIHEQMKKYQRSLGPETSRSGMLSYLLFHFKISLELETKEIQSLSGQVVFDIPRLTRLFDFFFRDIREAGYRILLFLDNIDELHHDYRNDNARRLVRDEAEHVLRFRESPIALLICLRSYFAGVLPRGMLLQHVTRLPSEEMNRILQERIDRERESNRKVLRSDEAHFLGKQLTERASTPLALITWFRYAASMGRLKEDMPTVARAWCEQERFPMLGSGVLQPVLDRFRSAKREGFLTVSREEILAALKGNDLHLNQLQDCQAILPRDFWNPAEFTLDPELEWLL